MPETSVEFRRDRSAPKGPIHYPFWFGGSASSVAACVTHPLDLIKVRLQTQSAKGPRRNMMQTIGHIFKTEGMLGFYSGLSASLLRQMTYSTTRFGVYEALKEYFTTSRTAPGIPTLIGLSSTAGLLGGIAGTPADVINVRMQGDAALPAAEQRRYKHAVDGLLRMAREEGLAGLWRGVVPNSGRAALMTASQLASYDAFKRVLLARAWHDDLTTHFTASFAAGFVATTVCSPVDVVKTRIMSAKGKVEGGLVGFVARVVKDEGVGWVFRGWLPSFVRLGPHTIATFMVLEQHKRIWRWYVGRGKEA